VDGNHLMLGKVLDATGNPRAALREYREAARLKPNDPAIRYLLFRLCKKLGDTEAASAELQMHEKLRRIYGSKE
jgi:Flp pilus assembly protein TadD